MKLPRTGKAHSRPIGLSFQGQGEADTDPICDLLGSREEGEADTELVPLGLKALTFLQCLSALSLFLL
uniref:Uncharacterized protein n=2 Tax=Cucumis melo TaxID=3656 RepID=A0A9I9E187_CUCME